MSASKEPVGCNSSLGGDGSETGGEGRGSNPQFNSCVCDDDGILASGDVAVIAEKSNQEQGDAAVIDDKIVRDRDPHRGEKNPNQEERPASRSGVESSKRAPPKVLPSSSFMASGPILPARIGAVHVANPGISPLAMSLERATNDEWDENEEENANAPASRSGVESSERTPQTVLQSSSIMASGFTPVPARIGAVHVAGPGISPPAMSPERATNDVPDAEWGVLGNENEEENENAPIEGYTVPRSASVAPSIDPCVTLTPLVEGAAVREAPQDRRSSSEDERSAEKKWKLLFATGAALVVVVVAIGFVVGVIVGTRKKSTPHSERYVAVKSLLESSAGVTFQNDDPTSHRHRALAWVADIDGRGVPLDDVKGIVQRYALAALYFATGGEYSWTDHFGFLSSDHECQWNADVTGYYNWPKWWFDNVKSITYPDAPIFSSKGVFCRNNTSTIDKIFLVENNLTGTLPEELGLLSNVTFLFLSSNRLKGHLPSSIGNLFELEYIYFSFNDLITGTIPSWIGTMKRLKEMIFDSTPLEGTIPSFLTSLPALEVLDFGPNCALSGTIPSFGGRGQSPLQMLSLDFCSLTGTIPPSIFSLPNLTDLHLGGNNLHGTLPSNIGNASNLGTLTFGSTRHPTNDFSGTLPSSIFHLSDLFFLDLSSNRFSGTLPDSIDNLKNLKYLLLAMNEFSGSVPDTFSELTNLGVLALPYNNFSGDIDLCDMSVRHSEADCYGDLAKVTCKCCSLCCSWELFLQEEGYVGCVPNLS